MSETIAKYMTAVPHSIGAKQPLGKAVEFMRDHRVRHLPVLHGGELVGILSDRDVVLLEGLSGALSDEILVEEAMTSEPYAVPGTTPLAEVLKVMADRKIGAAVVIDDNHVVGIYTSTDAVRMLAERL